MESSCAWLRRLVSMSVERCWPGWESERERRDAMVCWRLSAVMASRGAAS